MAITGEPEQPDRVLSSCGGLRGRAEDGNAIDFEADRRDDERATSRLVLAFVGLGLALRLGFYLLNYPLWWDEAFVAVNLLRRDFLGLLRPLDYGQVCPLLFLWAELVSVRLLGFSEWTLRLFPLICALAGVLLFWLAASQIFRGRPLLIAVAVFSVSVHPIRHAADVKPYATDLLVALALQTVAMAWCRRPERVGWLWLLALLAPIGLLLSHPAAFVVAGIGLALLIPAWLTRRWKVGVALLAYGLASCAAYAAIYVLFVRPQASSASPGMREMWVNSFPPIGSPLQFARWLVVAHTGDMLAYPCGGERGASGLSLLAAVVGSIVLWRRGGRSVLACLLAPLAVAMVAAALRLYPYGGPAPHGSAARIMQYAAPGLCLLIGLGASRMIEWIPSRVLRDRLMRLSLLALVVVGVSPIIGGISRPYRAYQAEAAREFARRFWPEVGRGAEVACLRWDLGAAEWDSIHLGIAVSLCNQAIYSPSRRAGGPRWGAVSPARPLRCVLGVGPERDSPRVSGWLETMKSSYDLTRRETIRVNIAEPGRPIVEEKYEVFEFLPKTSPILQSASGP